MDLFENEAYNTLINGGLSVESKERVVIDKTIALEDIKFDVDDLYETLLEVSSGGVYVTWERDKIKILKKLGILKSEGDSRWCTSASAELGDNGADFLDRLERIVYADLG